MTLRQTLTSLPRDARDTLFLLFVIVWVIAPQVPNLPVWTTVLAGGLLLWRGWLAIQGKALPGRWTVAALLALAVVGTLLTHRTILGRDAGVTLIVLLLVLKMLELRARRDAMVVFFLGFFTMLSNFFFSQSLPTAAAMLVALLGLLMALVNAHMPVGRPALAQTFRIAGTMALLGAPIMVALFMLFPRMAPLWGMPSENLTGRSGLSGTMKIGDMAEIALDERVAIRIRFEGEANEGLPQSMLYFRGPVMTAFDGRQWQAEPFREDSAWAARAVLPANLQVSGTPVKYEVTLEPQRQPWLMVLEATPEAPSLPNMQAYMTQDLQWLTTRPITDVLRYQAVSYPSFRHGPHQSVRQLRVYTELPPGFNPRTLELAAQLRADPALATGGPQALVNAALQRLRTGGYSYSLDPGVFGEHTADEFWFDRKEGFCEHIASAFVILMRAMDVPARIVTGYQGGERNPVDGYWTVRNADAHAWAEVWMEGRGWVRVDPTGAVSPNRVGAFQRLRAPQGAFEAAIGTISPGMAQSLRAVWEAVNNSWNQWVLNYTQSRQMDLLKALGFESPSWQDLTTVLGYLIITAAVVAGAWGLWERSQHDPWLRLLARTRQRLARAGLALPDNLPPRAMAERVQAQFGTPAAAVADWLLRLERLRYAPDPGAELGTLRSEFRSLPWPKPAPH
ncbi:transglutaminaseTgpA domain-containing protein [Acidovorax sp. NPDC077693]|uniref:transglutaminase family protein n=1 Tax=unclassified Acidovorax TaxID=2684926 RepID=UPI0037C82AF7